MILNNINYQRVVCVCSCVGIFMQKCAIHFTVCEMTLLLFLLIHKMWTRQVCHSQNCTSLGAAAPFAR